MSTQSNTLSSAVAPGRDISATYFNLIRSNPNFIDKWVHQVSNTLPLSVKHHYLELPTTRKRKRWPLLSSLTTDTPPKAKAKTQKRPPVHHRIDMVRLIRS